MTKEYRFKVGDKVTLKDDYQFKDQQVGIGVVMTKRTLRGWHTIKWENGRSDSYETYGMILAKPLITLTKKVRNSKIKKIVKEIKANKEYSKCFKDIAKEISEWEDEKLVNWDK